MDNQREDATRAPAPGAIRAYVLIEAEVGQARSVEARCHDIDLAEVHVLDIATVLGPYSLVLVLQADALGDLFRFVEDVVQRLAGVRRTLTCVAKP